MSGTSVQSTGILALSQQYRDDVLSALHRGGWSADLDAAAHAVAQRLARARQVTFAPHAGRAAVAAATTVTFVVAPLLAALWAWDAVSPWAALPLVILAGIGCYGGVAIVHDMAHGSFVASRRMNTVWGYLVSPLLLMEFGGFRRSHLGHHRHTQSIVDPKRFGVEHREETTHPDHSSLDLCPAPVRGWLRLGAAVVHLPMRIRQVLYLVGVPIVMGPAVLLFSGEFSVARRDWRRRESWVATLGSVAGLALLAAVSPRAMALYVAALLIGHSFTFHVFAAHMSPNQVYWTSARKSEMADALNVSDVHCGALVRWLGHGLSNYHSLHHLSPAIPCYHLPDAEAMVADDLTPLRAPAIDLLQADGCALLFDGIFSGVVHTNAVAWDYRRSGGMRRVATPEAAVPRG